MKVVATALVLIAGAAVVLWFGNTLNSWVLGGLIGGLAALLLSIPISLILFSYLSHRHDARLQAEAELAEIAQEEEYAEQLAVRRMQQVDSYALPSEASWKEPQAYPRSRSDGRNLPVPVPQRLPAQHPSYNKLPATQHGTRAPLPRPATKSIAEGKGRRATTQRMNYPGFPGYEPGSFLRHHKSAALHTARLEKARQDNDDIEEFPTHITKRIPQGRSNRELNGQQEPRSRSSHQLPPQAPQKRQRVVESTPSRNDLSHSMSAQRGNMAKQPTQWEDPQTDKLDNPYPQTEPIHHSTGQIARHPHMDGQQPQTENPSGSLKKPLVRRAPYMYDDDPLRYELSQQLNPPIVRRSSRLDPQQPDKEG